MIACSGCGAKLADDAPECPYCGAPTPQAGRLRREEAQTEAAREAEQRAALETRLRKESNAALLWALLGVPTCCLPVFSVLAVVHARRARAIAAELGRRPSGVVGLSLVLGGLGALASVAFWVFFVFEQLRVSSRREALAEIIAAGAPAGELAQPTACAMVEDALLTSGWGETGNLTIKDFECPGRLEQRGDRAELFDVRFRGTKKSRPVLRGCFHRGERWILDHMIEHGDCRGPAPDAPVAPNAPKAPKAPNAPKAPDLQQAPGEE